MATEYPNSWEHENEASPIVNGEITDVAKNWLYALSKLDNDTIKNGMENLHDRDSDYAPSPTSFIRHCIKVSFATVGDEIFEYIRRPPHSDWQWKSQLAYNVFIKMQYNPRHNESPDSILKHAQSIFKSIDKNDLVPIPAPLTKLEHKELPDFEKMLRRFRSKINFTLMNTPAEDIIEKLSPNREKLSHWMSEWYEKGEPEMGGFLETKGIAIGGES